MTETTSIPQYVTAQTNIGEAVMQYPVTAEIMMSYGLHCVGCHVSAYETIAQGAMAHGGMDAEDIEELILEMNQAIAEKEGTRDTSASVVITNKAHEKIAEFGADEKNQESIFLRVKVLPGGCSGFKYDLDWDATPQDTDTLITDGKYDVRIDPDSMTLLQGAVIDFVDGLQGSGFKIDNPNATQKCGCGSSFS